MKKNNFFKNIGRIYLVAGLLATTLLSSCLKDSSPGTINFGNSPALVGFQFNGFSATPLTAKVHGTASDTAGVEITLSVASITLSTPVTVTVSDDPTDAAIYVNANNGTAVLPPTLFSLPNGGSVTIKPGQQIVKLRVNFKGNLIDFTNNYVLGLKITAASGAVIATNLNVAILKLTVQSAYEGRYTAAGSFVDHVNSGFTDVGVYPDDIELITVSGYVVDWFELTNGFGYAHPINAGGITAYGSFSPEFDFDPAGTGKIVAVTNYYGQHSGAHGRSARLDVSGINAGSGTPGTVGYKIQVKYVLVQDDAGGDRTFFNETYTYTGPL
jgi:hypothetical protein